MGFDSKLNLSNCKFEQTAADSLNLSGCTDIYGNLNINSNGSIDSQNGYKICDNTILNIDNSYNIYIGTGDTSLIMGDMIQDCVILPKLKLRTAPEGSGGYLCYNPSTCLVEQTAGVSGSTGSISVGNGLSLSGNTVVLGGSLTGNTYINTDNGNLFISGGTNFGIYISNNNILLGCTDYNNNNSSTIISDQYVDIYYSDDTSYSDVYIDRSYIGFYTENYNNNYSCVELYDNEILIRGNVINGFKGIEYGEDYSQFYTARSIPDVAFVTGRTSGSSYTFTESGATKLNLVGNNLTIYSPSGGTTSVTANNGLTKDGDNIVLGGALTGNTVINLNDKMFGISNNVYDYLNNEIGFNNNVFSIVQQLDGKILAGGWFTSYSGVSANYIIRLNNDGSIDNTFNSGTGFNNTVLSIQLQSDGKILVGGRFTTYSGVTSNYIIRLNQDGTIDNSFNIGNFFDYGGVQSIQLQSDGKILVGGGFTSYSGVSANYIIRLNQDGTIDNSFNSGTGFDNTIQTIVQQSDGKILIGGSFTTYSGVTANHIIRLNQDGTIDNSFNSGTGFDNYVTSIQLQSDGKILVGGSFTTYSGVTSNYIIRLNNDGSINNIFYLGSGFYNNVQSIQLQSDGKILVGGLFTTYSGVSANGIIRLNQDGSIDNSFNSGSGFNSTVFSIIQQSDNKILVGGVFITYSGITSNHIIRLNNDGSISDKINNIIVRFNGKVAEYDGDYSQYYTARSIPDVDYIIQNYYDINEINSYTGKTDMKISKIENNYISGATNGLSKTGKNLKLGGALSGNTVIDLNSNNFEITNFDEGLNSKVRFNNVVYSLQLQSNEKILVGGGFNIYNGETANYIIRLNSDGSIDNTFNIGSGFSNYVISLQQQTNGKILAGGYFTQYNNVNAIYIIRLNQDGSIDNTFNSGSGFNNYVYSIELQSDGKILVGGFFTSYSGVTANYIIRLNTNGSIDNTFNSGTGFNDYVYSVKLQNDGKILVGGGFTTYSGVTANRIIRLNSDGSIDNTFNSGTGFGNSNNVRTIQQQSDGKILIGGYLTTYNGVTVNNIIRLNTDGSIDNTFNSGTGFNNYTQIIQLQSDDKILVGGLFTQYKGVNVNRIIRLNSDGNRDSTFNSGNGFNDGITSIQIQSNDKILLGGYFTTYSGVTANRIIRLNSNGSIDNEKSYNTFRFNGKVAEYDEDYSQYYTARSIPDVAFVTGRTVNSPVIYKASITLTASQIFNNTWVQIVPSPGTGKMIISDKCYLFYKFGTSGYSANELTIELSYDSGNTTHIRYLIDNTGNLLNATSDKVGMIFIQGTELSPSSNALYIRNNTYMTAPSGDGTLTLTIWYSIIDIE